MEKDSIFMLFSVYPCFFRTSIVIYSYYFDVEEIIYHSLEKRLNFGDNFN